MRLTSDSLLNLASFLDGIVFFGAMALYIWGTYSGSPMAGLQLGWMAFIIAYQSNRSRL